VSLAHEAAPHPPSALEFLHEFVGHYVALEGALWRTLRALASPGRLTLEYFAGRRRRYVLPLKLYLTASLVFFLAIKLAGPHPPLQVNLFLRNTSAAAQAEPAVPCKFASAFCSDVNRRVEARYGELTRGEWRGVLGEHVARVFPYAMFVLLPVFAMITRAAFAGHGRNYGEHLVFALHAHAAAFFWGALTAPFGNLFFFVAPASGYLALALLVVFRGSQLALLSRAVLSLVSYGVLVLAVVFAIIAATAFL
jgi:hypothetical protein